MAFNFVENRLDTFHSYVWDGPPIEKLAENGFICLRDRDLIQCFSCRLILGDLRNDTIEKIVQDHKDWSRYCQFLFPNTPKQIKQDPWNYTHYLEDRIAQVERGLSNLEKLNIHNRVSIKTVAKSMRQSEI